MRHRVVIVGGGFGGLYAARGLAGLPVQVSLVDRRNIHLFQPLLYQVATGGLSPGDIAVPLRWVLRRRPDTRVLLATVVGLDPRERLVRLADGVLPYDTLVLAAGASNHYFGHDEWASLAPSLKTVEDAVDVRRRILLAFERAEREPDPGIRQRWMTFVVVGGGPTGVELAGALSELARDTLRHDFRAIDPRCTRIVLVEAAPDLLRSFPASLSRHGRRSLERLGVEVRTGEVVTSITPDSVSTSGPQGVQTFGTHTVLWAAGVRAAPLARVVAEATGVVPDPGGRLPVTPELALAPFPEILVIGDMARATGAEGHPLPCLAPVAMQQGRHVAQTIARRLSGLPARPFRYRNRGELATIGRAAAVADFGPHLRFSGLPAWLLWLFVHLLYLVGFQNRVLVLVQWAWHYVTRNRGARIIGEPRGPSDTREDPSWA